MSERPLHCYARTPSSGSIPNSSYKIYVCLLTPLSRATYPVQHHFRVQMRQVCSVRQILFCY